MKKIFILLVLLTIAACSSNDNNETGIGNNYNRTLLLTNWADNIIIPSYVNYQTKIEVLATQTLLRLTVLQLK
jgi:hypothetical protein